MARTKLVVCGVPKGEPGWFPSRTEPLIAAEEAEHDKLDAAHPKLIAGRISADARIAALVPGWDTASVLRALASPLAGVFFDTPAKRRCVAIAQYWRKCKGKLRQKATPAEISAIDMTTADPFGDGDGWPT